MRCNSIGVRCVICCSGSTCGFVANGAPVASSVSQNPNCLSRKFVSISQSCVSVTERVIAMRGVLPFRISCVFRCCQREQWAGDETRRDSGSDASGQIAHSAFKNHLFLESLEAVLSAAKNQSLTTARDEGIFERLRAASYTVPTLTPNSRAIFGQDRPDARKRVI